MSKFKPACGWIPGLCCEICPFKDDIDEPEFTSKELAIAAIKEIGEKVKQTLELCK